MNIESQIRPELWNAISHSYDAENYTHAIKDAMSLVTDILRDKTGLDGDGTKLVGQALGFSSGKPPRLQVNKLQTESEKNIQIGLQEVLKGMYTFVRNPRSHERLNDTKKTADTIILFIDYLLGFLGESQQSFTIQDFIVLVTDRHFVLDNEYVEELIQKIPVRKRADTLIAVYRNKTWGQAENFELIIKAILNNLTNPEIDEFLAVVSDELMYLAEGTELSLILKLLPPELWPRCSKMSRLRAENILLQLLKDAWYIPNKRKTNISAATWASVVARHFLRKGKLRQIILDKLVNEDFDHHNFVGKYMMSTLKDIFIEPEDIDLCVDYLTICLEMGNEFMKDRVLDFIIHSASPEWQRSFVKRLESLTDKESPERYLRDGTPLLGKFEARTNSIPYVEEDDIPF